MAEFELKPYSPAFYSQVEEIFWLTSARTPAAEERQSFRKKYLDDYLPHLCFLALQGSRVLGYILCQPDPFKSPAPLDVFKKYFTDYPAHLHINTHPDAQGRGIGGALLNKLEQELGTRGVVGLHLVTHAEARNRFFYEKNDYIPVHETAQKLLLLGKKLRVKNL